MQTNKQTNKKIQTLVKVEEIDAPHEFKISFEYLFMLKKLLLFAP